MRLSVRELIQKAAEELNAGDGVQVRWSPFLLGAALTTFLFFGLALTYISVAPKSYTSSWSLILPGAGVNSRFSLDEIGQASTYSNSPYSSSALSPKVNYQSILTSRDLLERAAGQLGMETDSFGKPKVKLIQQTSLLHLQIKGTSPEEAHQKALQLHKTFSRELNRLRQDEMDRRSEAVKHSLAKVKKNLDMARDRLTAFKISTGLSSLGQFNSTIAALEKLRAQYIEARAALKVSQSEVEELGKSIGLTPQEASTALQINSDLAYKAYTRAYAEAKMQYAAMVGKYGRDNPNLVEKRRDLANTRQAILGYLSENYPNIESHFYETLFTIDNPQMEEILKRLVLASSRLQGLKAKVPQLKRLVGELEEAGSVNNERAARLEELEREHKIAKAVFSSALARMDSSQVDPFASYPLVQMLSKPTLPQKPSSPHVAFAMLGALLASLLGGAGWAFAWFHKWFSAKRQIAGKYTRQDQEPDQDRQSNPYLDVLFERLNELDAASLQSPEKGEKKVVNVNKDTQKKVTS